ncbi:uncharacterized protein LOC131025852 [Salvia miltiorrhiza]|uniref:uncharacterized protein LOC131025852 n=1 Tax=Salvia miltiorrhiza TaxID=226208 RepID=UPI0025AB84D5|nr:uncharacterized protein LOC131025852 [Salvia miltiorrhiza]
MNFDLNVECGSFNDNESRGNVSFRGSGNIFSDDETELSRCNVESELHGSSRETANDGDDALEEQLFCVTIQFSSDGSISNTPSCDHRLESELHASRLNLLEEIEKRKIAEETFLLMHSQWEKIRILMSEAGLTFPAPPAISDGMQLEDQEVDKMSQEVVAAKFVAEAVGRGLARAEAEETASAIIELKDLEILRLRDRLQYYETVNHEMYQRKLVA